jgi:hypothetical protein
VAKEKHRTDNLQAMRNRATGTDAAVCKFSPLLTQNVAKDAIRGKVNSDALVGLSASQSGK